MAALIVAFIADEDGQDLVEYALLSTAVGLAAIAGLLLLQAAIGTGYAARNANVNTLWQPPDPGGA